MADSLRGDLAWQAGDRAAADAAWAAAAEAPVDEATARTLAAKRHLADRLEAAPLLRHLLCAGGPHARAEAILDAVPAALAGDPVAMVLWARRALRFGDEAAAVQVLEHVLPALREGHPLMYAEAARVLGRALARSGRCAELAALGPALTTPGQLSELRERCALANRAAPP
ncbi:MAG: hypothetical protein FJ100_23085 [Deltaproteobacteria bacterium]|nr:hypothetical protein [Deltaproteobacteria bacterium]